MKTTISKFLKRKFLNEVRSIPSLEKKRSLKALALYDYLVFLERYLLDYELGEVVSLGDYFTLRDFSESASPFLDKQRLLRDLNKIDQALSRGERLGAIRKSTSYRRLLHSFSQYLQDVLDFLEIPFSLEIRTHNQTKYVYFAPTEWTDATEIPTELRLHLAKSLIEHSDSKKKEELKVKETLLILKNTFLPDMNLLDDTWTEQEKESMRLSGFLTRSDQDVDDPIKKKDFTLYDKNSLLFYEFIRQQPKEAQKYLQVEATTVDSLEFTLPSPSDGEATMLDRRVTRNSDGKAIHVYNSVFEKGTCIGTGYGSQVVFGQIISALKIPSMRGISLLAADVAGYYVGAKVWPRFGYDGQIKVSQLNPFSEDMMDYLYRVRLANAQEINVSTILSAVDEAGNNIGLSWWLENSIEFKAHFDLDPSSLSMRVFTSYFRKKLSQFDMTAEEFLSMDLPIDLSEPYCLLQAIKKINSIEGLRAIMPDILSTFDSASADDKDYLLSEIENLSPLLTGVLKSKRGSSQYTDPTAESVWAEIGQEMIRDSEAQRARELLVGG